MMKKTYKYILIIILSINFSCYDDIVKENNSREVFEVFYKHMKERYVNFSEHNINWDSIYTVYSPKINDNTSEDDLKMFLKEIIIYIGDRHTNIKINNHSYLHNNPYSDTTKSYFYYISIEERGLDTNKFFKNYFTKSVFIKNFILCQAKNSITYFYLNDFMDFDKTLFLQNLKEFDYSKGLIIDIRGNEGGFVNNLQNFCSMFFKGNKLAYYMKDKTGKGYNDFTDYFQIILDGTGEIAEINKTLLIDYYSYSAASISSSVVKDIAENCCVIGETTGGGGSGRFNFILPNGWILSWSYNKHFNTKKEPIEYGVEPNINATLDKKYYNNITIKTGRDTVMETAINYLLK